jgi:hypothetical protein
MEYQSIKQHGACTVKRGKPEQGEEGLNTPALHTMELAQIAAAAEIAES